MELIRRIERPRDREDETISAGERPPRREWLVTNGLGGYASGTVAGVLTRRYHGMLVAALPAPLGRLVMLNHVLERVRLPGKGVVWLGDQDEVAGPNAADKTENLAEFRLELGLPIWLYRVDGFVIEKRVLMPYGQNTVHLTYRVLEGDGTVRFNLRPSVHYRNYDASVDESSVNSYTIAASGRQYELSAGPEYPALKMTSSARVALSRSTRSADPACRTRWRRRADTSGRGRCGAPAISASTPRPARRCRSSRPSNPGTRFTRCRRMMRRLRKSNGAADSLPSRI